MSTKSRQRRAAKAKARAKARQRPPTAGRPPSGAEQQERLFAGQPSADTTGPHRRGEERRRPDPPEVVRRLLLDAVLSLVGRGHPGDGLRRLVLASPASLGDAAEALLLADVANLWQRGWQPAELLRQGRRGCRSAAGGRLIALAIATDHADRRSVTLDSRWQAQVATLDLPAVDGRPGWAARWIAHEGADSSETLHHVLDALANLRRLPPLEEILPPPGSAGARSQQRDRPSPSASAGTTTDPVLARIRALLAKAESTTFEAEALAFTAKAHELMTRHAIDAALLQGSRSGREGGVGDGPTTIRIPIDPPYVDAKSYLLQIVAQAGRGRAIQHLGLDLSTVVGHADDVAAIEVLFTSLLVQAQTALAEAARYAPPGTRTRSQGYRSAFLLAYANRIGERLEEVNEAVLTEVEADQGGAFLPVLRSQAERVGEFVDEHFGTLRSSRVRGGYDPVGWSSGRQAADRARLNGGDLPTSSVA